MKNKCARIVHKSNHHVVKTPKFAKGLLGKFVCAAAAATLSGTIAAHDVDDTPGRSKQSLGHSSGKETKRIEGTGQGMPSVRGPFPDTVNMEWLGQVTNGDMGLDKLVFTGASFLSDIWGWTDDVSLHQACTDDEYAIVGTSSGVAFVRITDPTAPEFLGIVPTTNTGTTRNFWWDIKTYQHYAYWTTEVNNAGVGIFDLRRLCTMSQVSPGTYIEADARWGVDPSTGVGPDPETGYIRAHNVVNNPDKPYLYLTGVSKDSTIDPDFGDDGIVVLDISNPLYPFEVGTIDGDDIDSHDAQVVTYTGPDEAYQGKEILVNYNGTKLNVQIWNVSDVDAPSQISTFRYANEGAGAGFAHQGWFTGDHDFILLGDEEDELFGISQPKNPDLPDTARTHICDARNLAAVDCYGFFDSPAASIDHNLFVKDGKVYQAHYTAGIRVLKIHPEGDRIALSEIAHMDTEPRLPNKHMNKNINIFVGPWGVYPFFDSGTIAASDGLNGLVLMRLTE